MTQTAISCTNGSNGTATVNVTGGTAPFSYKWSTGATAQTITGLSANAYSVTVTDNLGCSVAGSTIIVNPSAVLVLLYFCKPYYKWRYEWFSNCHPIWRYFAIYIFMEQRPNR